MREILFRGKRLYTDQWVEAASVLWAADGGVYIAVKGRVSAIEELPDGCDMIPIAYHQVAPETVGQYTGLTDKDGRKIFEGDILKEEDIIYEGEIQIRGDVWSIGMRKGCWVVMRDADWDFLGTNAARCAIIGNIYDNPELLKQ